jgi:hypothetical protein
MIPKSVQRFSEKIMLKQEARVGGRFEEKSSRSRRRTGFLQHSIAQPFGVSLAASRQLKDADGHGLAGALVAVHLKRPTHVLQGD